MAEVSLVKLPSYKSVSLDHTYDKSTLVQVMDWCRQATSHYLSQCWPRSMSPYGVTRPQWVKGCISLDPSKISKSGWWGLQLDAWQLCNSLWYGLINSKLHINKKVFFLYHTTSDGVTVQCFKSPSWPLRDGLDLWPQLIYTLSWESQHEEI